jgi:ribose/xylose/arabinose/galactoside ABC-type transport system permease subunit
MNVVPSGLPIFFPEVLEDFRLAAPNLASAGKFENLTALWVIIGILANGQSFPILWRGIDVSDGAILALALIVGTLA